MLFLSTLKYESMFLLTYEPLNDYNIGDQRVFCKVETVGELFLSHACLTHCIILDEQPYDRMCGC